MLSGLVAVAGYWFVLRVEKKRFTVGNLLSVLGSMNSADGLFLNCIYHNVLAREFGTLTAEEGSPCIRACLYFFCFLFSSR